MGDTGAIMGREGQGIIEDTYYRGGHLIVHRVRVTGGQMHLAFFDSKWLRDRVPNEEADVNNGADPGERPGDSRNACSGACSQDWRGAGPRGY